MITVRTLLVSGLALAVAGCTTPNDIDLNTDYQYTKLEAEKKRLETISEISKQGESGVVAAAILMQQGGTYNPVPPKTTADRALDLAKTVLGDTVIGVGQIAATVYAADAQRNAAITASNNNKDIAINNSDNNATVTMHTHDTMADIAEATIVNPTVVSTTVPATEE